MSGNEASQPARLQFRQLTGSATLTEASEIIAEVFGAGETPIAVDLMIAIGCSGGFVGGALLEGRLVGVAVGFGEVPGPGSSEPVGLHSHVAAVRASARGLHIGQQLKWYQRDWALARGISVIHWTFDPLVRRNAVLNLNRLGAVAATYREDMYGSIPDALNAEMESDRLLVRWELESARVTAVVDRIGSPPERAKARTTIGKIETPVDIEALVAADPSAARAWRGRQRRDFQSLPEGWLVTGIDPDGRYEVEQS